jgi:peptidyl-tRNA hydrolase
MAASDFVLHRFTDVERNEMDVCIADCVAGVETWITDGLNAAMNQLNPLKEKADE